MYTVSKGPSKIVAKTRRGISQNLESLRDHSRKPSESDSVDDTSTKSPKPVFHINGTTRKNGQTSSRSHYQETLSPQHEEIIRYINESWNKVATASIFDPPSPLEMSPQPSPTLYYVDPPSPVLRDFKPFDLESWWGRRLFHNITKSL